MSSTNRIQINLKKRNIEQFHTYNSIEYNSLNDFELLHKIKSKIFKHHTT